MKEGRNACGASCEGGQGGLLCFKRKRLKQEFTEGLRSKRFIAAVNYGTTAVSLTLGTGVRGGGGGKGGVRSVPMASYAVPLLEANLRPAKD